MSEPRTEDTRLPMDLDACSLHPDECCNCPPEYDPDELEHIKALVRGTGKVTSVELNILLTELDRLAAADAADRAAGRDAQTLRRVVLDLCDKAERNDWHTQGLIYDIREALVSEAGE
jgi:hypothetical protein